MLCMHYIFGSVCVCIDFTFGRINWVPLWSPSDEATFDISDVE